MVAVGDIACPAGETTNSTCQQAATATLAANQNPDDILPLGDNQYDSGLLASFRVRARTTHLGLFNPIVHPVPGNHEYDTSGAGGYFQYFGDNRLAGPPTATTRSTSAPGTCRAELGLLGHHQLLGLGGRRTQPRRRCRGCSPISRRTRPPARWRIWHHPLFSDGDIGDSPGVAPLWSALYNAHADVVLNGHDHLYERYAQQDPSGPRRPVASASS